jgi:eukaryotic-like serine/threonine-protein kinase
VSLGRVHARFLVGAGAWLLGASAATGGSLLAVSALGQSIAPAPSQQLTPAGVSNALASEKREVTRSSPPQPPVSSPATPMRRHPGKRPSAPATPSPPAPSPQASTTVLTSAGGTVVAGCQASGAYLVSWSPAQGYQVQTVVRGPAATAKATFAGARKLVTMAVTCPGGSPSEKTTIRNWGDE